MYKEVVKRLPQKSCQVVEVPVYDKASTGDVFLGSVIGGVLGNQIGEGSGKDAATVVGAILGAHKAQENYQNIIGYRQVNQCSTQYVEEGRRLTSKPSNQSREERFKVLDETTAVDITRIDPNE